MPFNVMARITRRRKNVNSYAIQSGMKRQRQIMPTARLEYRMEIAMSHQESRTRVGSHLDEVLVSCPAVNLLRRRYGVAVINNNRRFEDAVMISSRTYPSVCNPLVISG